MEHQEHAVTLRCTVSQGVRDAKLTSAKRVGGAWARLIRIVDVINANRRMRESACMEFVNAAVAPSLCYVLLASTWFTTRFT